MQASSHSSRPQVAIVGPYPPPYGGMSVGIQRLGRYLEANGVDFLVYNEAGRSFPAERVQGVGGPRRTLLRAFMAGPRRILHYQNLDWRMRCLVTLWGMLTGRKSVVSIHAEYHEFSMKGPPLQNALIRFFLKRTSAVIACNPAIVEQIVGLTGDRSRVHHVPAFMLPPPSAADAALPADLEAFLAVHSPRLLWMGWAELWGGRDAYGLDQTLTLLERLRERFPDLGCVLWFSGIRDEAYWKALWQRCVERGLDRMLFVQNAGLPEIFPLFRRCDVYLRPTVTDGDSVSVREALALGTPVVASDAAPRPSACVTFRTSDADDFLSKVETVLGDLETARAKAASEPQEDNGGKILAIYRELGL
jgi:glycosyltransferase involved in cell wall biosynthesis